MPVIGDSHTRLPTVTDPTRIALPKLYALSTPVF
jgi:hypothetical protein